MTTAAARPERPGRSESPAPLVPLFDAATSPADTARGAGMPDELVARYGGELLVPLRPDRPTVIANFVSTLDGIVALGTGELSGGGLISGFHEPDRFVMGLLRSLADVVVVGAGTVRGSSDHRWTADHVHPRSSAAFRSWREAMGLPPQPTTIVVTARGDIPVDHRGLGDPDVPVVIATTPAGAAALRRLPLAAHVSVEPIGTGSALTGADLLSLGARLGARLVLTEGGPHLLGELVGDDLLDELFLTLAPQIVGRDDAARLGLVEGLAVPPDAARWHTLASVRRSGDHLFLRYTRRDRRPPEES